HCGYLPHEDLQQQEQLVVGVPHEGPGLPLLPTVAIGRRTSRHVLQDRRIQVLMSVPNWSPLVIYGSKKVFKTAHFSVSTRRVLRSTATTNACSDASSRGGRCSGGSYALASR